ncbi:MAG TPA: ester cyclase, partial [Flavobacteriales bacterium]|nr:ester cyclase [Flavobacteriales bacterium]
HIFGLLPATALVLLAACGAPADPATDKARAEEMKADSAKHATLEANKEAMKKVFTMFETGKTEGIENIVADNIVSHVEPMPGTTSTGLQLLKETIAMQHTMWPDAKWAVTSMVAEGDLVFAHYHMTGTMNAGSMGPGMPAANKPIDINGVDIVRYENGKGVEHWGYWEESKMMQQMGMMPPAEEAGKKK